MPKFPVQRGIYGEGFKGINFSFAVINIQDEQGNEILVGVSHEGVASYKDKLVLNRFAW